ncbi:MAG: 50S ribosomal protein L21 [Gammaproteobacteria bacterium]|nr:50S ribosomal protein L21 [Gammaproteobacteria bacterium]
MMYAVIATGGKQYRVQPGQTVKVEKLDAEPGATVTLDRVLLVGDGENVTLGEPLVKGSTVTASVARHGRSKKVDVIKFKRRKGYRRTRGHRQHFTELKIEDVKS